MTKDKVSKCCNAPLGSRTSDDGTSFWVCAKCDRACDPKPMQVSKSRCKTCGSLLITDWGGNKCIHCNRDEILHSKSDNYVTST